MGKKRTEKDKKISKHKKKKRCSSTSSSSSSSISSIDEETKRKLKKKIKKLRKKEKIKKKEKKALIKLLKSKVKDEVLQSAKISCSSTSHEIDFGLIEKSKSLAPMTKEEWEKQQNTLKRVYDEETGRMRLMKGSGEIVEECVSRGRHLAINKQATRGDDFHGVYLLKCLNPDYKGRTYIGYTVDPNRRIKQHNKGKLFGGARKTSKKGPWEMTLTVHGFPSDVAALRFEWAWQHPKRSRRLKSTVPSKKASETSFEYCLKIMFIMLRTPPWCRLPLTIRWLLADVMVDPPPNLTPPKHMPIIFGAVVSKKLKSPNKKMQNKDSVEQQLHICRLCLNLIEENQLLVCLNKDCLVQWHILCLAKHFLSKEGQFIQNKCETSDDIVPVEGCCTECSSTMLWGDLIRKRKGCYRTEIEMNGSLMSDSE